VEGFSDGLPREYNPARGYVATANNNTHPPDYKGRPVFYNTTRDVNIARITRIRQLLDKQIAEHRPFTIEDMERIQQDSYSLHAERDAPLFNGWTANNPEAEKARAMIAGWDRILTKDSVPGAIYVRWTTSDAGRKAAAAQAGSEQRALVEQGLLEALERLTKDWGSDSIAVAIRPHQPEPAATYVHRRVQPEAGRATGGFNDVTPLARIRRIIDFADVDKDNGDQRSRTIRAAPEARITQIPGRSLRTAFTSTFHSRAGQLKSTPRTRLSFCRDSRLSQCTVSMFEVKNGLGCWPCERAIQASARLVRETRADKGDNHAQACNGGVVGVDPQHGRTRAGR
jgi:hypothetical protein